MAKLGLKQYSNPTPAIWSNAIAIFTVVAGAVIGWIGTATFISAHTSTIIQSILGLLLTIANGLKPFIGVETNLKSVPIEDVTAMEETKS